MMTRHYQEPPVVVELVVVQRLQLRLLHSRHQVFSPWCHQSRHSDQCSDHHHRQSLHLLLTWSTQNGGGPSPLVGLGPACCPAEPMCTFLVRPRFGVALFLLAVCHGPCLFLYRALCLCRCYLFALLLKYTASPSGFSKFWIWSLAFQKYTDRLSDLHFVTYLVPNFCQKYIDGPCGLHFETQLVPNLDLLKPLDLLAGD
ncbi:hypothetical protein Hanom_Chr16g01419511 [Helianthus anomalus]